MRRLPGTSSFYFLLPFSFCLLAGLGGAQEKGTKDIQGLAVVNAEGKEMVFKTWKTIFGTRKLTAQAEPVQRPEKGEKPASVKLPPAQEYLEFREDHSTTYFEGILTLVPLSSIRRIDYNQPMNAVAVTLAQADAKDLRLTGTTKYKNINKLTIDVGVDVGDLGPSAIRCRGGSADAKPAIASFRFPKCQPAPKLHGLTVAFTAADREKTVHKVQDLKALYRVAGVQRISADLLFENDHKIEASKITRLRKAPAEKNGKKKEIQRQEYEVTLPDRSHANLVLVKHVFPDDGSPAELLGLIGRVPAGYKLFPLHTFTEMRREGMP